MKKSNYAKIIGTLLILGLVLAFGYYTTRIYMFLFSEYSWYENIITVLLLAAEFFIIFHGFAYLIEVFSVIIIKEKRKTIQKKLKTSPHVAVLVPSYKEDLTVLEPTLVSCYNIDYPNMTIYLLDDTRYELEEVKEYKKKLEDLCRRMKVNIFRHKWRGAKAGIINDFIAYISKNPKKHSRCLVYGNEPAVPKYFAVFDADQNPFPDFLTQLVSKIEKDPKIAFYQTPQYYTNILDNKVAKAAGMQQIIFFEYICEGKNVKEAMFCTGTNFLMRFKAFQDVGGFDETSVTEDFSTSIYFHLKGWKSFYEKTVSAFGMGPQDLINYFKQQARWSTGTLSGFKTLFKEFIKHRGKLPLTIWWEYGLSSSYYLIGFVYLILMVCPALYLIFNVPSYFNNLKIYGVIFGPYLAVVLGIFYGTLKNRGYDILNILSGQVLMINTFPIYMRSAFNVFMGKKKTFLVTQKKDNEKVPLSILWPQISLGTFCFISVIWGFNRIYYERNAIGSISVNIFWCALNSLILFSIFYFLDPMYKKRKRFKKEEESL